MIQDLQEIADEEMLGRIEEEKRQLDVKVSNGHFSYLALK